MLVRVLMFFTCFSVQFMHVYRICSKSEMEYIFYSATVLGEFLFKIAITLSSSYSFVVCLFVCLFVVPTTPLSSIKQNMVEAKAILTERLYADLGKMIKDLLDGENFANLASIIDGPSMVLGGTQKVGINEENLKSRHCLPVFNGKYHHEIFGMKEGHFSK